MHIPGESNFQDRRGKNTKPAMPSIPEPRTVPYFAEDFIPARGYALIECRFLGASSVIHIPDSVHSEQQFAVVRAMGEGKHHYNGGIVEPEWKIGDYVYAAITNGRRVELGNKKLVLLGTEHILGKFPTIPKEILDQLATEEARNAPAPAPQTPTT